MNYLNGYEIEYAIDAPLSAARTRAKIKQWEREAAQSKKKLPKKAASSMRPAKKGITPARCAKCGSIPRISKPADTFSGSVLVFCPECHQRGKSFPMDWKNPDDSINRAISNWNVMQFAATKK